VNSAIACPNHDEVLDLGDMDQPTYTLRGYAYSGGGRRVTRVEITLDDGASWELANIHYIEDQFREAAQVDTVYGTLDLTDSDQCFCWCFWTFDVPLASLQNASSIAVRAMDESLGLQPRNMYWNATGMMNNWCVCCSFFMTNRLKALLQVVQNLYTQSRRGKTSLRTSNQ